MRETNNGENKMSNAVTSKSTIKEITAEIRKQSRALAKQYGCKVSVTKEEYAGGRKVYVNITESERAHLCPAFRKWQNENPHTSRYDYPNPRDCKPGTVHLADWAIELREALKEIVDQFNWDNSDTMSDYFDVNYYTDVDFSYRLDQKVQAELDAAAEQEAEVECDVEPASNVVAVDFPQSGDSDDLDRLVEAVAREFLSVMDHRNNLHEKAVKLRKVKNMREQIEAMRAEISDLQAELATLEQ